LRRSLFEALASGFTLGEIAAGRKVSVATIRREIDKAIAAETLDGPRRYVHLQVARLMKALRLVDMRIERDDLKAVGPLIQVVAALDRYHGLNGQKGRRPAQPLAVPPLPALANTHAEPPVASAEAKVASVAVFWA
jgi:hypothetical protein